MRFLLAILCPPLSVFLSGKIFQAVFISIPLTLLGWIPGVSHAIYVVNNLNDSERTDRLVKAQEKAARRIERAVERAGK